MLKVLKYLKPYIFYMIVTVFLTFGQVMANLQLPDYMAEIVNKGIILKNIKIIFNMGGWMIFISVLGGICTVGGSYFAARISTQFAMKMRKKIFEKVENFSLVEFNKFSTSSLITRTTNDIQQIQMLVFMMLRMMIVAPITAIGAMYMAYKNAPNMTWVMGGAVICLFLVIVIMLIFALPKYKILQKLIDKLNLIARENLTGLRVIRAFNAEKYEEGKFDNANNDLTALNLFLNRLMAFMHPVMMLIFNVTSLAVIWFGAKLIEKNELAIGNMLAFVQYSTQVLFAFTLISIIFIIIPRAAVSGNRVAEVLETEQQIKDSENPIVLDKKDEFSLEFKKVSFSYPDADKESLVDISFSAKQGQTIALIGSTGSGKSTLVNLILRFYDVSRGTVLINGVNVRDLKLKNLYDMIGYVSQKNILFSGSIESNVKYGVPKIENKQMEESIEIAQANDFVKKLNKKYKSKVSQRGTNFSGGQKQRLAIARAIAKNPKIYIFDDSFSALDFKTDKDLRKSLKKETAEAITMIVAQRISTIINADKILVLNEGKIVGSGNHLELIKTCKVYQEIADSQFSKVELDEISKVLKQ